jgi:hypothetical protein
MDETIIDRIAFGGVKGLEELSVADRIRLESGNQSGKLKLSPPDGSQSSRRRSASSFLELL